MKGTLTSLCFSTACLFLIFGFDPGRAQHSDAHSTPSHGAAVPRPGPANAVVEFENESIVVLRIRMVPGEKTPMHDITSARLVVWLTDVHLRDIRPDGSANETHRHAGEIDWVGVQRHAGENLSHEALEFLAIVPKAGGTARK